MYNAGDFDATETVYIPVNTFSSNDPSESVTVTDLVAGDVEIHKDGSTTQRSSDAGVTVSVDFDTVTGNHLIAIDLSDNTDAGFFAAGSRYLVRIEGATVDAGTVNAWVGGFSIGVINEQTTAALTALNLDHLLATATSGADMTTEVVDNSVISRILGNGDTSAFDPSTDGLQPLKDSLDTAADIVNEWETQSQADPTGFHVNVLEVNGTSQTAGNLQALITTVDTVVDSILAMLDDARAEPGQGALPVNPDLATKVDYLYKFIRNKTTSDADSVDVYADDGTTVDHTASLADNGTTFTRGEMASGA